jgi:hypothetical protein
VQGHPVVGVKRRRYRVEYDAMKNQRPEIEADVIEWTWFVLLTDDSTE